MTESFSVFLTKSLCNWNHIVCRAKQRKLSDWGSDIYFHMRYVYHRAGKTNVSPLVHFGGTSKPLAVSKTEESLRFRVHIQSMWNVSISCTTVSMWVLLMRIHLFMFNSWRVYLTIWQLSLPFESFALTLNINSKTGKCRAQCTKTKGHFGSI